MGDVLGRSAHELGRDRGEDGYAAIDALVGLTVLGIALSLSMGAVLTAGRLAARAEALRQDRAHLERALMQSAQDPRAPQTPGLTLTTTPLEDRKSLCRVEARIDRGGRNRAAHLVALRPCPPELAG